MPRSYQMADEEYTAECRDIARKIEEYNTAVGKFVQLGEDALEESGSSDGAAFSRLSTLLQNSTPASRLHPVLS